MVIWPYHPLLPNLGVILKGYHIAPAINCSCGTASKGRGVNCATCHLPKALTPGVRVTGWIMLIIGTPLFGITLLLLSQLRPVYTDPQAAVASGKFGGTVEQAIAMLPLLPSVALFGFSLLIYGLWRIKTGRRNLALKLFLLGTAVLFLWFGYQAYLAIGQ
jgi:hypothetical protein